MVALYFNNFLLPYVLALMPLWLCWLKRWSDCRVRSCWNQSSIII